MKSPIAAWNGLSTAGKVLVGAGAVGIAGVVYLVIRARAAAEARIPTSFVDAPADPGPGYTPPQYIPAGPPPSQYVPPGGPAPSTIEPHLFAL